MSFIGRRACAAGVVGVMLTMQVVANPTPCDVWSFIKERESCDHFRAELEGNSVERRARQLNRQIKKFCSGTDKRLAELKEKYSGQTWVLKQLEDFEHQIEAKAAK